MIGLGIVSVAAAAVLVVSSWVIRTRQIEIQIEHLLSEALQRPVSIEEIDVRARDGRIDLWGVEVGNRAAWDDDPLLWSEQIELEADVQEILAGTLEGHITAHGVELWVLKRGDTTNLHHMVQTRRAPVSLEPSSHVKPSAYNLDLSLDLVDAKIWFEDLDLEQSLAFDGVDLHARLTNQHMRREARISLKADAIEAHAVRLRDVDVQIVGRDHTVELTRFQLSIGESGAVEGNGAIDLATDTPWTASLTVRDLDLGRDIVAVACDACKRGGAAVRGRVAGMFDVEGTGLVWSSIRTSLRGIASLSVQKLSVPLATLAKPFVSTADSMPPWTVSSAELRAQMQDGWASLDKLQYAEDAVAIPVSGRVGLDGALDLDVDIIPVARLIGGSYAAYAQSMSTLPVHIGGTMAQPEVGMPTAVIASEMSKAWWRR